MPTKTVKSETKTVDNKLPLISKIGFLLILLALFLFVLNYFPIVTQEVGYITKNVGSSAQVDGGPKVIIPIDTEFGIVVPKIGANTRIVADVNPFDSAEYQVALTKGVAHAKDTVKPDQAGNVFLFAHSSDNFFNANTYNSIFYLLHRLENDDTFDIYYKGIKYQYQVIEKSIVDPSDTKYLTAKTDEHTATLMTCWPPGTTLKRLVVVGIRL